MSTAALAALGGVGNVAGTLISSAAQSRDVERTNQTNKELAREQREWSHGQAQNQMNFQERMSSSAYQRAVGDLQRAGLNPMLAAFNGGASAPSGAMGSGQAAQAQTNPAAGGGGRALSAAGSGAFNTAVAMQEFEARDAQIAATRAQGVASLATAGNADSSAAATKARLPGWKADSDVSVARSKYDVKGAGYDAVVKRILEALGGASDAVSLRRLFQGASMGPKSKLP